MAKVKSIDELTQKIYKEFADDGEPVTMQEAKQMAEMEAGYKEKRHYEATEEKKKRRTKQASATKKEIFQQIYVWMKENFPDAEITKENKLINFTADGRMFKLDLVEQTKTMRAKAKQKE